MDKNTQDFYTSKSEVTGISQSKMLDSEMRFRTIFENSPLGIIIVDTEGHIIDINKALLDILGSPSKDHTMEINIFSFPLLIEAGVSDDFKRCIVEKRNIIGECPYQTKWGKTVYFHYNISPILDESGEVYAVEGLVEDITNKKSVEKDLEHTELQYRTLIETANDAIFIADTETGMILECNKKAEILLKMSADEIIGLHQSELHPPEDRDKYKESFQARVAEGKGITRNAFVYDSEGNNIPVEISASVVNFDGKKIIQGCFRETTARKKVEDSIQFKMEFEDLIMNISTSFINLDPLDIDEGIQSALEKIGKFCKVERSYIFLFNDDQTKFSNTHEWCEEGVNPCIDDLQNVEIDSFPVFSDAIKHFEVVHIPRVVDMSEKWKREKERFMDQDIKSLVCVPMIRQGVIIGFLGLDAVKKETEWGEDIISILRIVGTIFVNALERKQTKTELKETHVLNQSLLKSIPYSMMIVDEGGEMLYVNASMQDIIEKYPYGSEEWDHYKTARDRFLSYAMKDEMRVGETETIELDNIFGGKTFQISYTGLQFKGKKALLETFIDMTERKDAESKLLDSYRHLAFVNRQVSILLNLNRKTHEKHFRSAVDYVLSAAVRLAQASMGILFQIQNNSFYMLSSYGVQEEEKEKFHIIPVYTSQLFQQFVEYNKRIQGTPDEFDIHLFDPDNTLDCFLLQPLMNGKDLKGAIFIGFRNKTGLTTQELDFYNLFALQTADILFDPSFCTIQ